MYSIENMRVLKNLFLSLSNRVENRRGVALPMALSCIMIVSILVLEFSFSQQLSKTLAFNDYDMLKAEYLARSGLNISLLKLKIHSAAIKLLKDKPEITNQIINIPIQYPFSDLLAGMTGGSEYSEIEGEDEEEGGEEESEKENTGQEWFEGNFFAMVKPETGLNINHELSDEYLRGRDPENGKKIYEKNIEKFYKKITQSFDMKLESSLEGDEKFYSKYRDVRIDEIIYNIVDWVDKDSEGYRGGDEDVYYEKQTPPYRSKNGPLDTLDELLLIEGVTDDIYELFKEQYSVYSEGVFLLEDIVRNPDMMKWLSDPELTDDSIQEIAEDFSKEETEWKKSVKAFEDYIRQEYRVDFNESGDDAKTPHVKLSVGNDINRYSIVSTGVFKKTSRTIEAVVDRSSGKYMVFLYYNYY